MSDKRIVRVRDVMSQNYELVEGRMLVSKALLMMKNNSSRVLIVDKRTDEDEYGIVLLTDIAREVIAVNRAPERVNIYEVMTKPVVGVDPDMDVKYCARLFGRMGFSYAPVLENNRLLGIVGYADMLLNDL